MANFEGTIQEFHHFLGPRIRNAINNFTRNHRKNLNGICEECGFEKELHSAHIHGSDRRTIIENVLSNFNNNGIIRCDIELVEKKILEAHLPIEKCFKFLCHSCHLAYDSEVGNLTSSKIKNISSQSEEFEKISRIKLWASRPHQDNHKMISAFLYIENNGEVSLSDFKKLCTNKAEFPQFFVPTFDGHYPSMKTDRGNSHGKVFYDQNGIVSIWPQVREEIKKHFK